METMLSYIRTFLASDLFAGLFRAIVLLAIGLPLLYLLARWAGKALGKRLSAQGSMLLSKGIIYTGIFLLALMIMRELGFKLTTLLGAAGIAGVAIGFASQTSLSNVISGFFLIWEKPFEVGDALSVGDTLGLVHSIDLLSVKLRTFDNRFIRIPNEHLVKSTFINITRFPIRRFDINVDVAYKEDIPRVMKILEELADRNPYCLDEPAPLILFNGFGESSLKFLLGVWFAKADFLVLRNSIMPAIKARFDAEGIEIPFPHCTLYAGSATDPFPVRIIDRD